MEEVSLLGTPVADPLTLRTDSKCIPLMDSQTSQADKEISEGQRLRQKRTRNNFTFLGESQK